MVKDEKNIEQLIHICKRLKSFFIFICIYFIQTQAYSIDSFEVDNINIEIVSEDISHARSEANNKAILIGLDRFLSWKLDNKDYTYIKNVLNNVNKTPDIKDFVAGYKIHYEKISDIKYQAEFSILFNIENIKNWLVSNNIYFYEKLNSKTINLNANFNSFKNWRIIIDNIENIKEVVDFQVLSLTYKNSIIKVSINIENETSLFNIFNKSRIDIQKRLNSNYEYNISLIDYNKTIMDSFDSNDRNNKKDSSILLTE